jgi:uncharacterized protein YidB (DUF937 family)
MGLIGTLLRMFLGRSGGGMLARVLGGPLLGIVLGMMRKQGGLGGMLDKFRGAGMQQKADSWVSTGPNEPLSPDEVEQAMGHDELERISNETGLTVEEVRERLAKALPEAVNEVTPNGRVPDENQLGGILDKLGKFLPR